MAEAIWLFEGRLRDQLDTLHSTEDVFSGRTLLLGRSYRVSTVLREAPGRCPAL